MFAVLSKTEKIQMYLRTISAYPEQIVQCISAEEDALLINIGAFQFDELLAELSFCARNGLDIDRDWEARVRRGNSTRDADSLAAVFLLHTKVMETAKSINSKFFPYAITRTPAARVICYNRLQGMQLAEYAAELIDSTYKRPQYLWEEIPSEQDSIARLVGGISKPSY